MHCYCAAVRRYRNATCVQYGALESVMYSGCDAVSEQAGAGVVGTAEEAAVGPGKRCVQAAITNFPIHRVVASILIVCFGLVHVDNSSA